MTVDEMRRVLKATEGVDGDCTMCHAEIIAWLRREFPELDWEQVLKRSE